jgi:microcystin-dependent protein/cytoskeletal protein CcmA (bactofilin family)
VGSSVNFYYNTLTASGVGVNLWGMKAASPRWLMQLGNEAAESGGNVGSDFVVGRFSDAGGNLGATFTINRSTGLAAFAANLQVNGAAGISGALGVNGTLTTNQITANGDIYAMSGVVRFRDAGKYLYHDGTNFNLVGGGTFTVNGNLTSTATVSGAALSISGAATIAGTVTGGALSTAGAVTGASLSISGAATIGGNLAVTGRVSGDGSVPPGAIMDFGMPAAPAGWTPCDGGAISRVTYAALFAAIGTTWGAGDGSSTFNVPQLISRFRRHRDNGSLAGTVGTLKSPANLAHTHPGITGIQDADHTHAQQGTLSTQTINGGLYPNAVSHTHSVGTVFVGTNNFGAGAGGVDVPATHTGLTIGATNTDHAHNFILSGQTGGASASHHHGFTTDGGSADDPSEARPYSAAVLTCIKL